MGGSGGQASAIAQLLAKDWVDERGVTRPGIYDENNEYSVRWAEPYKNAKSGCLKIVEPRKYRNALFEAAKVLVPQGAIKFPPNCPNYDTLTLDDGTERKLSKAERASLIQMDLMKEEICAMVKVKTAGSNNITYKLPPEKANKMHDDRNYCFVLCCWEVNNRRAESEYGDGAVMDYSAMFTDNPSLGHNSANDNWGKAMFSSKKSHTNGSPFQGTSPFK